MVERAKLVAARHRRFVAAAREGSVSLAVGFLRKVLGVQAMFPGLSTRFPANIGPTAGKFALRVTALFFHETGIGWEHAALVAQDDHIGAMGSRNREYGAGLGQT